MVFEHLKPARRILGSAGFKLSSRMTRRNLSQRIQTWALAFPLVVLAQQRHMLLYLSLDFREGCLHACAHVGTLPRGVQRACGKVKSQGKQVLFLPRTFFDSAMQLHEIR